MQCALSLAPENRYVLRSAARIFGHIGDPDQALHALKNSGRSTQDPWLLAADIALQGDKVRGSSVKLGMRLLSDQSQAPRHLSELAAAVGTVEHDSGRHKAAKKLFAQSLIDPNDNSVAQAVYISQIDEKIRLPDEVLQRPQNYEARARRAFASAAWDTSMQQSWQWLCDEPFDITPAILGSCLSFDSKLTERAKEIATAGLRCAPANALLLNNRAVANAYLGNIEEALVDVTQALRYERDRAHLLATLALVAYRSGQIEYGMKLYGMSIAWLVEKKDREAVVRAYLYWLREAVRVGQSSGEEELKKAKAIISRLPPKDLENEIPGLLAAIDGERASHLDGSGWILPKLAIADGDLASLEERFNVPAQALTIYPMIANETVPTLDEADRLAQ